MKWILQAFRVILKNLCSYKLCGPQQKPEWNQFEFYPSNICRFFSVNDECIAIFRQSDSSIDAWTWPPDLFHTSTLVSMLLIILTLGVNTALGPVHTEQDRDVNVNVMLIVPTFDLSDGPCDDQNGLHTHFARPLEIIVLSAAQSFPRLLILNALNTSTMPGTRKVIG